MRASTYFLAALFVLAISSPAFALSTDHESGMNTDGTAKFADPDEQQPSMLNTPLTPPGGASAQSNGSFQITPGASMSISGGPVGGQQQQQDAFDHAYAHFGN